MSLSEFFRTLAKETPDELGHLRDYLIGLSDGTLIRKHGKPNDDRLITVDKLPDALRSIRKTQGLTQEQFGALVGKDVSTISMYETGHRRVSLEFLENVGEAFGFDVFIQLEKKDTVNEPKADI